MRITVKYFASIREAIGVSVQVFDTQAGTLAALRDELMAMSAEHAECLARGRAVRLALNQVMVDESASLSEGAEVAFFPPVTGG
jgi:molybdopterin synthase sulfur carrier subunit